MGLYYPTDSGLITIEYADAAYLSDPADAKSQIGYIIFIGPTAFSWKSSLKFLTATSFNHFEIIALYEASCECIWLRHVIDFILIHTGMRTLEKPTVIF
jgi:hypothetical protein